MDRLQRDLQMKDGYSSHAVLDLAELTRIITSTRLSSVTDGKIVIDPEITAKVIMAMNGKKKWL